MEETPRKYKRNRKETETEERRQKQREGARNRGDRNSGDRNRGDRRRQMCGWEEVRSITLLTLTVLLSFDWASETLFCLLTLPSPPFDPSGQCDTCSWNAWALEKDAFVRRE